MAVRRGVQGAALEFPLPPSRWSRRLPLRVRRAGL